MTTNRTPNGRDYLWLLSGRIVAAIAQALCLVLLARWSTPRDFGLAMSAIGALLALSALFGFGFGPYVTTLRARNSNDVRVTTIARITRHTGAAAGAGCLAALLLASIWLRDLIYLAPLAVSLAVVRNSAVWQGIALGDGRSRLYGASLSVRRVGLLVVFAPMGLLLPFPALLSYSLAYLAAEFAGNVMLRRGTPPLPEESQRTKFRAVLRDSRDYWGEPVFAQARGLDVLVASLGGGAAVAGFYAIASRLSSPVNLVPTAVASLMLPDVARNGRQALRRVGVLTTGIAGGIGASLLVTAFLVEPLIPHVLGDEYSPAASAIRVYLIGLWMISAITLVNAILQGLDKARTVSIVTAGGSLSVLVGVFFGAQLDGALGASLGYSVAVSFQAVVLLAALVVAIRRAPERADVELR